MQVLTCHYVSSCPRLLWHSRRQTRLVTGIPATHTHLPRYTVYTPTLHYRLNPDAIGGIKATSLHNPGFTAARTLHPLTLDTSRWDGAISGLRHSIRQVSCRLSDGFHGAWLQFWRDLCLVQLCAKFRLVSVNVESLPTHTIALRILKHTKPAARNVHSKSLALAVESGMHSLFVS